MEKCRDVTQGYTTQQECDKWPQQICQLEKKVVKKYSPETEVKLFAYNFSPYWDQSYLTRSNLAYIPWLLHNFSAKSFPVNCVDQVHALSLLVQKNAEKKWKRLCRKYQKSDVLSVHSLSVNLKQNWCRCKMI